MAEIGHASTAGYVIAADVQGTLALGVHEGHPPIVNTVQEADEMCALAESDDCGVRGWEVFGLVNRRVLDGGT